MVEHVWLLLVRHPDSHNELIAVFENELAAEQAAYEARQTGYYDETDKDIVTAIMDVVPETADEWFLDEMEEANDA